MSNRLTLILRNYLLILLVLLPSFSFADDFPDKPVPPRLVNDLAHVMSADEVMLLERKLKAFSDSTTNQVSIVTIQSLGNYEVADYATQLGNRWGIGKKQRNNGVLILVAMQEHRMTIVVGRGLEGALPDITAGQIINREMKPSFRENNYYRGLDRATSAIMAATRGEYKADEASGDGSFIPVAIVIGIFIFIIIFIISRRGGGGGGRYISRRGFDDFGGGFMTGSIFGSGWGSGGSSGGGGDSGFGGFGGGSFGGGGASGSW